MKAPSTRALALEVLSEWSRGRRYASDLLDLACQRHALSASDAAFLHEMVLSVVRNVTLLDRWIEALTGGRHLDHRTRWLLRLGLAQVVLIEVAPHAAVNETVGIAGKARGLVNAVLRRAGRERASLIAEAASLPAAIRFSHPEWLVHRWEAQIGAARAAALCEWNQQPAATFVRANTLRPGAAEALAGIAGLRDAGDGFFQCSHPPREALLQGLCYAQDRSTAVAVNLLDPRPGETILDACAAPGGKSTMIAAQMRNQGRIVACDVSPSRLKRLQENLDRMGVTIGEVTQHDLLRADAAPWPRQSFDRILLDVPCSNSGVMRRRVDVRWRLQPGDFEKLAATQERLIAGALRFLKPGGVLVYSTCSVDAAENRAVVDRVLDAHPRLRLVAEEQSLPPESTMDGAYAAKLMA